MDETEEVKECKLVDECVEEYSITDRDDGGVEVFIKTPGRFRELCLSKLGGLVATVGEVVDDDDDDTENFKTVTLNIDEEHSMLYHCADRWEVKNVSAGAVEIRIDIGERYAELWREKVPEIMVTGEEMGEEEEGEEEEEEEDA